MAMIYSLGVQAFLAVSVLLFFWISGRFLKYNSRKRSDRFRFLNLPPELRLMVYEEVLADKNMNFFVRQISSNKMANLIDTLCNYWIRGDEPNLGAHSLSLTNHLVSKEFTEVLNKKGHYNFTFDQDTVYDMCRWNISPETFGQMRECTLRMKTTSKMLGAADPRLLVENWNICQTVCNLFNSATKLKDFELHILAIPDPLWNPLWLWHHASQNFKTNSDSKVTKITFSLDNNPTSLGENHLERDSKGEWEWRCADGHFVCSDPGEYQAIRDFCQIIYQNCDHFEDHQARAS